MTTFVMDATPINQSAGSSSISDDEKARRKAVREEKEAAIISTLGTQEKAKTVVGFISGYIDLGIQARGDYTEVYDPNSTKHKEKLENGSILDNRFNWDTKREENMVCTTKKPAPAFVFTVDFPQYMIDYGEGIGKRPYRMMLGGEDWVKNDKGYNVPIIRSPFYKVQNTNNPVNKWALGNTTTLHKMASALDILNSDGLFTVDDIPSLFNKPLMFKVQAFNKENDKGSWFTEKVSFVSEVPDGLPLPEWDGSLFFGVNVNKENSSDMLDNLRITAINTIKRADDYDKSIIKKELDSRWETKKAKMDAEEGKVSDKDDVVKAKEAPAPVADAVDDDNPFDDDVKF